MILLNTSQLLDGSGYSEAINSYLGTVAELGKPTKSLLLLESQMSLVMLVLTTPVKFIFFRSASW